MRKLLYPPHLSKGSLAVIISPSGNTDATYIDGAKTVLENWGLQVKTSQFAYGKYGRFGGTVEQRLYDLQSAMDDKNVKLILCSRGGYGIVQLIDQLDFTQIKQNPKWLVGYSDITALHLAFMQNGIMSLHAPMARHLTEYSNDEASNYTRQALFDGIQEYQLEPNELNKEGNASGTLLGGNLAVLCGLTGTPYMKIPRKGILFIEDIAENPYKIDRMMWQLKLSGILSKLSGLIIGQFSECEEDPLMGATIYDSIRNMVDKYNYPVIFDFPVGHVQNNYPLVHGSIVNISVKKNNVILRNNS